MRVNCCAVIAYAQMVIIVVDISWRNTLPIVAVVIIRRKRISTRDKRRGVVRILRLVTIHTACSSILILIIIICTKIMRRRRGGCRNLLLN